MSEAPSGGGSSVAGFGTGMSLLGTAVTAFGDWFSGEAQANFYNYQRGVALANAQIARQDAIYATQVGEVEAQQSGMRTRAQVGATRVGFGAGNISSASGSPAAVLKSEVAIGQANEATLRANAAKRAYGFDVAAAEDVAQAGAYEAAAKTARTASYINIASTIIGGAGQVSTNYLKGQQYGVGSQPYSG